MKSAALFAPLFALSPIALMAVPAQDALPEPLSKDFANLAAAKALHARFEFTADQQDRGLSDLWLARDRKFKLVFPAGFVLSDGENVYSYNKPANTYTKSPLTEKALDKFENRPELIAWAPFFEKEPQSRVKSAQLGPRYTIKGGTVQDVIFALAPPLKATVTLTIDQALGVARGAKVEADRTYVVVANDVSLSAKPDDDARYVFVAPDGSSEVPEADSASFSQVQDLMTDNCMPCHDQVNQRAGFDLTSYDGVLATVTAGKPADSLLVKALRGNGADLMPRGRAALPEDKIHLIETWIQNGANKD